RKISIVLIMIVIGIARAWTNELRIVPLSLIIIIIIIIIIVLDNLFPLLVPMLRPSKTYNNLWAPIRRQ
ncbi:MAG: hypothetical protein N7Q72_06050, partial [Spiroplasma sp. Tabriz.8]|nr:hypothetical protein [Candidatus Regiella insecticola]MCX2959887.1 hypothetical protein [Serratia symbiotica]MCZ8632808.1 hypothetical protein [Spiroplasma sp. Tabriz.8]